MAFVSSVTTTSFSGISVGQNANTLLSTRRVKKENGNVASMQYFDATKKSLSKYADIATSPSTYKPPVQYKAPAPSSKPSTIWTAFVAEMLQDVLPNYGKDQVTFRDYMKRYRILARINFMPSGSPNVSVADKYMSECIKHEYKGISACSTGVYNIKCTEGTIKLQADQSRILSLASDFRRKQFSTAEQYGNMFAMRKMAIVGAHNCSYEEALFCKLPASSSASVNSMAESLSACSRSAISDNEAENYMMNSVETQCKMRKVPNGVYTVGCMDGTVKDMAEDKRVFGLSAKFRASQTSKLSAAQQNYDRKKYARDMFAHECSYEEGLFNKYPSMAASISGPGAKY